MTSEGTQGQTRGRATEMPGLDHLLLRQVWKMSKGNQADFKAVGMEQPSQGTGCL